MNNVLNGFLGAILIACVPSLSAHAEEALQFTHNGIEYKSSDGNFEAVLGGRLHLDAASIDDGSTSTDDEEVRRARLELGVRLFDKLRLRVDREFTNGGGWRNVWARYDVTDHLNIKGGNFIAPFSMEDLGSSNEGMFMERSLAHALSSGFGVGGAVSYEGPRFTLSGGYFTDPIDAEDNVQAEKGKGVVVRGTWSPIEHASQTLHLGAGIDWRDLSSGDLRRFSSGPEASLGPTIVRTGAIANVDKTISYNLEGAYSLGPVLVQAQYMTTDLDRTGASLNFDGYYVQVGWVITGEKHAYSDSAGVFSSPVPKGRFGAVELAARASSLDLSEVPGAGSADDLTAGVNWYLGRNFRLMANYVHSEVDNSTVFPASDADVVEARAQISF